MGGVRLLAGLDLRIALLGRDLYDSIFTQKLGQLWTAALQDPKQMKVRKWLCNFLCCQNKSRYTFVDKSLVTSTTLGH